MAKSKSRTARWQDAANECRVAFDAVTAAGEELSSKLSDLLDVQSEYQDWADNLPENLQQSAIGEKLQAVTEIGIEAAMDDPLNDWGSVESTLDEAEGVELPMGFGRD